MFSLQELVEAGVAKGLLPGFIAIRCDDLVAIDDHPKMVRPL